MTCGLVISEECKKKTSHELSRQNFIKLYAIRLEAGSLVLPLSEVQVAHATICFQAVVKRPRLEQRVAILSMMYRSHLCRFDPRPFSSTL